MPRSPSLFSKLWFCLKNKPGPSWVSDPCAHWLFCPQFLSRWSMANLNRAAGDLGQSHPSVGSARGWSCPRKGTAGSWLCTHPSTLRDQFCLLKLIAPELWEGSRESQDSLCIGVLSKGSSEGAGNPAQPVGLFQGAITLTAWEKEHFSVQPTNKLPPTAGSRYVFVSRADKHSVPPLCSVSSPTLPGKLCHVQVGPGSFTTCLFGKMFPHHCYRNNGEQILQWRV